MPALIGEYEYSLDPANRMVVPPRYRDLLKEEKGARFILAPGFEKCLYLFLPSQWDRVTSDDKEIFQVEDKRLLRRFKRHLFGKAVEVETDEQGRVVVPQRLKEYAGLRRQVVVKGLGTKAEVWDKAAYAAQEKAEAEAYAALGSKIEL